MDDALTVKCEKCDYQFEVDHLSECTYTMLADDIPIGEHVLCRVCSKECNRVETVSLL